MEIGEDGETGLAVANPAVAEIKQEFVCAMTHQRHTVVLCVQAVRCTQKH